MIMANVKVTWDAKSFTDKTRKAATDGLEEFAKGVWQPQAQTDVLSGLASLFYNYLNKRW